MPTQPHAPRRRVSQAAAAPPLTHCAVALQVETVKKRCLPGHDGLNLPMLEEYDFRNDRNTPNLVVSGALGA